MEPLRSARVFLLRERTPSECRLTSADVDFLLSEHSTHVDILPTGRRHRYRLAPGHHVGTIVCPDCRLIIRPKIPVANLYYLLDPTTPMLADADRIEAAPGSEALDFLAGRLARLLAEQGAAGLHRAYAERGSDGPFLQGRLDLPSQLRTLGGRKDRLHCRHDDFTVDVPCNQVPRATAELVLGSSLLGASVRLALRRSLEAFQEVSPIALHREDFSTALPGPSTLRSREAYRPLLDLCRLLFEGLTPRQTSGSISCPTFLLDMERVFERYVTQGVLKAFDGKHRQTVSVQRLFTVNKPDPDQPDLHIRPDLTIDSMGAPRAVVDAKWKELAGSPLVPVDLYQVLAYCVALGVSQGFLVYPGRRHRVWNYPLTNGSVQLTIQTLRVLGSPMECTRSLRRLGRMLRSRAVGRKTLGSN